MTIIKAILIGLAAAGFAVAGNTFRDIIRDPDTKGWGVGLGLLAFLVFSVLATLS